MPRAKSKTKNHTATTAAPRHPAITPSLSTEVGSRSMSGAVILALAFGTSNLGILGHAKAVIRVAEMRRQRRAVGDGTPGIGVAPGAAAADPAGAVVRAERILRW